MRLIWFMQNETCFKKKPQQWKPKPSQLTDFANASLALLTERLIPRDPICLRLQMGTPSLSTRNTRLRLRLRAKEEPLHHPQPLRYYNAPINFVPIIVEFLETPRVSLNFRHISYKT